ncbi:hypothetical protein J4D99_01070 [Siccationidurans ginsengisoli]|nr:MULTISPECIES: hypothetical protein [unclassified Hymenobacter]MBO2029965.1 hypothetical protein [Hymenobacter sp. BT559]
MTGQTFFITEGIAGLARVALGAAVIVGVMRFKHLPSGLRYLVALLGLEVATELAVAVLHYKHQPNLFILPFFSAGEFWLLALVYDRALQSPAFSRMRPWLAGSFVAYCLFDSLVSPEMARFKPALQLVESVLVLGLVGLFFRKLLSELRITRLDREPMFWVSTGLIVKHLGSIQIFLFSNFLLSHYSKELNLNIWAIHGLLLIVLYSCYLVALWIRPQN